jgi:hypothetical protein
MSIQDALFDLPVPKKQPKGLPPGAPWLDQYPSDPMTDQQRRGEILDWLHWWYRYAAQRGWRPSADLERFLKPEGQS